MKEMNRMYLKIILLVSLVGSSPFLANSQEPDAAAKQEVFLETTSHTDTVTYWQLPYSTDVAYQLAIGVQNIQLQTPKLVKAMLWKDHAVDLHIEQASATEALYVFATPEKEKLFSLIPAIWASMKKHDHAAVMMGNVRLPKKLKLQKAIELPWERSWWVEKTHGMMSSSRVDTIPDNALPVIELAIKPKEPQPTINAREMLTWQVLQNMLQLPNATFRQKLLGSGLALSAKLNSAGFQRPIMFSIQPNPYGIKACIDSLFGELYILHRFDYATVDQLNLAKQMLLNQREAAEETFSSQAFFLADYLRHDRLLDYEAFTELLASITKVDVLRFVKQHVQRHAFHLRVQTPLMGARALKGIVQNTIPIDKLGLAFKPKQVRLSTEMMPTMQDLVYLLGISPPGQVTIHVQSRRKRRAEKRANEVRGYLKQKSLGMQYKIVVTRKRSESTEPLFFTYKRAAE